MSGPILLATRSAGKLRELRPMFESAGLELIDLDDAGLPELAEEAHIERYDTFEANAIAKARYFRERSGGLPVVADDSGLEVVALGGAPGVRSKRWSGREDLVGEALDAENNRKLLTALAGREDRRARYVCVVAYVDAERELLARGETGGRIVREPRGEHGFGYDPLFESRELGRTFGEVSGEAKARVSHRGRAFRRLVGGLRGS